MVSDQMEACTLADCPPGLFLFGETLCFRSEYSTTVKVPPYVQPDAYVVESGEYFWGGAKTSVERSALRVHPCDAITLADLDAAVQAEREAIQKAIIAEINDPRNGGCDGYGRGLRDGLRSARILAARGPTPALDAALAQARQETWEKAREAARNVHPSAASATGEAHMRSYRDAIVHAISAAAGEEGQ